jgi:hypothetical protein
MEPVSQPNWAEIRPPVKPETAQDITAACSPLEDAPPKSARRKSDLLTDQHIEDRKANRALREKYADKAYQLACGCICFWVVVIAYAAFIQTALNRPPLSDTVLIAVTTGVTVNVLAAFLGVIRGLFPSESKLSSKTLEATPKGKTKQK